ncbi:O-antigen ligase family protein [Bremerella sp. JC817]|uniref:O-antigen ligase family protein n=1 Tax=Bremerella sp. JC817 TaxID=3231756 RepID=UPI003459A549
MASKSKQDRRPQPEESSSTLLRDLVGGGIALLAVVTPLVSSEGSPERGAELWLAVAWCLLLLLWGVTALAKPKLEIRWGLPEWCLAGFLTWLAFSTWFVAGEGNLRAAFNNFWDYAHLLIAYFLIRQWVVTDAQRHALLTVMICLAAFVSAYALYQYQVLLPAQQAAYRANPEQILLDNGIDPTPGNPVRQLFENRVLNSSEPTATFTLTNSLAGFLVPWLLLSIGWLKNAFGDGPDWKRIGGLTLVVVLAGICLLLTKSRTAWLATIFGLMLIGFYGSGIGKRVSWLVPTIGLTAFLGLFMIGFVTGVLDVEVLSEAPKSVLYRLQYWQGAAAIIAHNPIFGCGLGNFQGYYPQFMLPMASETVADPHNFVFEIWAMAGTPAIALLLAAMVCWSMRLAKNVEPTETEPAKPAEDTPSAKPIWIGAAIAPFIAPLLQMIMQEMTPDFTMVLVGIVPAVIVGLAMQGAPIVRDQRLWLAIALAALLIDLLAAGGIGFPSVAGSLFLLAAVASPSQQTVEVEDWRFKLLPMGCGLVGLMIVILWGIQPSTGRKTQISLANMASRRGDWREMEQRAKLASAADLWSKEGPAMEANIYFEGWANNVDAPLPVRQPLLDAFESSLDETFRRAGHYFPLHFSAGNWYLDIYRQSNDPNHLLQGIDHYREAVRLYPNRAIHHAQLAWALHLAGLREESVAEAEEALRLDDLNPHAERRLEDRLKIHDPGPFSGIENQPAAPAAEIYAKQVMENLRTMGR